MIARFAYTLLWWLALPFLPVRLWWRGRREPLYRSRIGERFGRYAGAACAVGNDVLWIHAVSVGETRAVAPLIERLVRENPRRTILLTHMTATGREAGRALFGNRVAQAWLPYDIPFAVRRFLTHFHPRAGLLVETELWPNLTAAAARSGMPLLLINARLSERSARGYSRIAPLARPLVRALAGVAAQTPEDADRLRALGAREIVVTGNLKFDVGIPSAMHDRGRVLRGNFGIDRRVLVLASTRDGEEALLLDALARATLPSGALVVIVPRHPQRFDTVAALLIERRLAFARRSEDSSVPADIDVVLGDSMGEMFAYYTAADVAFVGGSLLPLGGQNLIEPIAAGVPTLVGPHTFNFAQVSDAAVAAGAALRVQDADELFSVANGLLANAASRERMRVNAEAFVSAHRGAVDRVWQWLAPRIDSAPNHPEPAIGGPKPVSPATADSRSRDPARRVPRPPT
ncbi:MAG: lipid IV(A) 3-deoxy-D-manno-octulosonic acid transferase [Pseudomonadota bacterium]|nr:lipid IV(A) 3-deoxy-D-manno-octulosonic acid transferase [Pseudomonadota bacterium]